MITLKRYLHDLRIKVKFTSIYKLFKPLEALAGIKKVVGLSEQQKELKVITLKQADDVESLVVQ